MTDWSWQPDAASGISVHMVRAGGLDFEVAEAGTGDRLALLLHGWPELNYSWRHQIPLLVSMGYRVWAPNQRGYGASSRPDGVGAYRLDALTGDVAALIDASGAKSVTLIAHDWGAAVAWAFAAQRVRPLERLVIMNVPHPACMARELKHWHQLSKSWYIFFFQLPWLPEWMLTRDDARGVRRAFVGSAVNRERFSRADLDVYAAAAQRPGAMTAMLNWYRAAFRGGLPRDWPVIQTPTLMIWGEKDIALDRRTVDGTDAYVRDFTLKTLPDASHWVQQDAPDEVNGILAGWLAT
jgi:epoxide hydrolase 4